MSRLTTTPKSIERTILRHLHTPHHRTLPHLTQIHAQIIHNNLHQSNHILAHFISICGTQNQTHYAHLIFQQTHHPNILLFNSIIKAHSLSPHDHTPLTLFRTMKRNRIWPDEYTFAPLLKASSNLYDVKIGRTVHGQLISSGFCRFSAVQTGVVELYVSFGAMGDARKVFDEMSESTIRGGIINSDRRSERNIIVWNLMIKGYFGNGNVEMGLGLFREMGEIKSVVTWNTVLSGLSKNGLEREALGVFREMCDGGVEMDEVTVVTMLRVCARVGDDEVGKWIHLKASELVDKFVAVGNALVDFYCKRGFVGTAVKVFDDMREKNVVTWNVIISGLAVNGEGEKGISLFDEMTKKGLSPNESTFVGVLTCCVHSGLVQRGKDIFSSMVSKYGIEPRLEHYGCMVDLLGRGGLVKEAYELIKSMPMEPNGPNAALWGALLSACCNHGEMELAEVAVTEVIRLEPWNSGSYVLLSNVYAEKGKWDEVERIRLLMMNSNVSKEAGQSMIR